MGRVDFSEMPCTVAKTLEAIGDRWSLLIVRDAFYGLRRFDEFTADLGIARNVLTDRLAKLVEQGIFAKVAYEERPLRHEYVLTEKGRDLLGVVLAMAAWGDRWTTDDEPPVQFDHRRCGAHGITPTVVCDACGEPLVLGEVRAHPSPVTGARSTDRSMAASGG
jgi:DNA-binding HxlR family transcriptional regulator